MADSTGVDVRSYTIIYEMLDELRLAMEGLLEPETREIVIGHALVLQTFVITKVGTVAGLRVTDGLVRDSRQILFYQKKVAIRWQRHTTSKPTKVEKY